MIRQCVILVGGQGTRLGPLTQTTPKPLLPVGGRPFLELLLEEAARYGFTRIVLLAGYLGGQVTDRYAGVHRIAGRDVTVTVIVEPKPAGTGGALQYLRSIADEVFLVLNGDSWFDIDLRAFAMPLPADVLVRMALRRMSDTGRYGTVHLERGRVLSFAARGAAATSGEINAGVYLVHRAIIDRVGTTPCSLEADVFSPLAARGLIEGVPLEGFFIDIGVPDDYASADRLIAHQRWRPAVFFERNGTVSHNERCTCWQDDLRWIRGAQEAIRRTNQAGFFAFAVTSQAEASRGRCDLAQADRFHARMDTELAELGAHIDEFRCSLCCPETAVEVSRWDSPHQKPKPSMILDLATAWPVDLSRSLIIGKCESNLTAATTIGIRSQLFGGYDLDALVSEFLPG